MKRNNLTRKRRKRFKRGLEINWLVLEHIGGKQELIKGRLNKLRQLFDNERGHK